MVVQDNNSPGRILSCPPRSPRASMIVADVGTPASFNIFCKVVISPACMKARAPSAGQRTACCSRDSFAPPLVSHTWQVAVGPHCQRPSVGAPVSLRMVTLAASAGTLLAWGVFVCKTETLP